jgi:signal transduction histidine kinase
MRRPTSFQTLAMAGSVVVTLLLAGGTVFTIRRLDAVADSQIAHIRAKESEITTVERLRWSGELIVSGGRGYLLSADPALLAQIHEVESDFDRHASSLRTANLSPEGRLLVADVQRAAIAFRNVQEELITARQHTENSGALPERFDHELRPRQRELALSLARLVDHKEDTLEATYGQARRDRARLAMGLYGLLALLVLLGVAITFFFARLLSRAYAEKEAALEAARKAISTRDELMAIVAHDLRNPLGAITMKSALLRQRAESETSREQARSIENVSMRMEYLIKTMLDGATLEAGGLSVTPVPCEVDGLLRESGELFGSISASKQIQLEFVSKEPGLVIRADRGRVLQVLSNLIGNALKFTPPGGRVWVYADRLPERVHFAVRDTGPGIAAEHLPNVFDRFWKHETQGKKGTGLGLFIAKGIIDAHAGRIWVESAPGGGATFHFTLPIGEFPSAAPEAPRPMTLHADAGNSNDGPAPH